MRIAISVAERVHRAADQAAKRQRVPRGQFYVRAVEAYLEKTSEAEITARPEAVYSDEAAVPDAFLTKAARTTASPRW